MGPAFAPWPPFGRRSAGGVAKLRKGAGHRCENGADGPGEDGVLPLRAYVTRAPEMDLRPAPARRRWMDATTAGFANRCLPMLIANQWGWFILNERRITVSWNGGPRPADLHTHYAKAAPEETVTPDSFLAISHFGHGILTWRIPYIFETPPGWNLYIRGPTNWCKDGATALDGVVETDWAAATFTMNWKVTRPDTWIAFEEGEPICMIFPVQRGNLERFSPEIHALPDNPGLEAKYREWRETRDRFLRTLGQAGPGKPWQKHYFQGRSALGEAFPGHQTKVAVRGFQDLRRGDLT